MSRNSSNEVIVDTATGSFPAQALRIVFTDHALRRLKRPRQEGIYADDVIRAARSIPWVCYGTVKFRNFISKTGKRFAIVIRDLADIRLIVTVIGPK